MNSIDWLIEKLGWNNRSDAINRIVDEAKEMHKAEILAAFTEGASDGFYGDGSSNKEKYYTETFGSKDINGNEIKFIQSLKQPKQ